MPIPTPPAGYGTGRGRPRHTADGSERPLSRDHLGLPRPVDLVVASAIKNPYFRQSVEQTKALLYAA